MTPEVWKDIKEIVVDAVETDPQERKAFLDRRCPVDLRQKVEDLLNSDDTRANMLDGGAESVVGMGASDDKRTGTRIGAYRIVGTLGAGGMGTVYLAERSDGAFEQKVAVKLIKRGMDTDAVLRRFYNERQILATLEHANIARIIDGGTTDDGRPYFVMEYVEGVILDEYCDELRLTIPERLKIFRDICSAVSYAHSHSVIHRDLKPSNILVKRGGTPKLLDFGIAKILRTEGSNATQDNTDTLFRAMTPRYASPEQIRGERVTAASDVYSLGVLLYELLTGQSPFESTQAALASETTGGKTPKRPSAAITHLSKSVTDDGGSDKRTLDYVCRTRGEREPRDLRRRLRGNLDDIVLMSIERYPDRRYSSVDEFSNDIDRHQRGLPVRAKRAAAQRAAAFVRGTAFGNQRPSLAFVVLFLLIALAASVLTFYVAGNFSKSVAANADIGSIAILPFKYTGDAVADENPLLGAGLADFLIARLGETKSVEVRPMSAVKSYINGAVSPQPIGENLNVDAVISGAIRRENDLLWVDAGMMRVSDGKMLWQQAFSGNLSEITELQKRISEGLFVALRPQHGRDERISSSGLRTSNGKAYDLYVRGQHSLRRRDTEGYKIAIENFQQALSLDPNYADAYSGLADGYALLACVTPFNGRHEKMRMAKEYAHRAVSLDESLANPHATLGFIGWHYDWDWEASDRHFKRAIELNPSYAQAHHWYAYLLVRVNRGDEAVAEIKRALALDPLSPIIYQDQVEILLLSRRFDEAITVADRGLEIAPLSRQYLLVLKAMALYKNRDYDTFIAIKQYIAETEGSKPVDLVSLASAYFSIDRRSEGQKILDDLRRRGEDVETLVKDDFWITGDLRPQLKILEIEYENRGAGITQIHTDPNWDTQRLDPRVAEYIARVGTSQYIAAPPKPGRP